MLGVCDQLPTLSHHPPQPSSPPQQEPSRTPAPKLASIPALPPPLPSQDRESIPSRAGNETQGSPLHAVEQRSRAQLHAQDAPSGPGPFLPSRRGTPTHLNLPRAAPIVLPLLSFPEEATPPPSIEPGGQETAVHQGDGGCSEHQEDWIPLCPQVQGGWGKVRATV